MSETRNHIKDIGNKELDEICAGNYFMMRQHSDIIDENKFDHVSMLGLEPIESILNKEHPFVNQVNEYVIDTYLQLFINDKVFSENMDIFGTEKTGVNYTTVESYNDIFKGFIRNENYFILLNSDVFDDKFGVFILIDNSVGKKYLCNGIDREIEFYGFINIGYLINQNGYSKDFLTNFENVNGFTIPDQIKIHLENSSILKYNDKLFHIDLKDVNSSVKIQFDKKTKNITNSSHIKNMTDSKDDKDAYDNAVKENKEFIKNMLNGFLYLGTISKLDIDYKNKKVNNRSEKLYLLLNYKEQMGIDHSFSIWKYSELNVNTKKILDMYSEENKERTLEEFENMEKHFNIFDPCQIFHSLKMLENI